MAHEEEMEAKSGHPLKELDQGEDEEEARVEEEAHVGRAGVNNGTWSGLLINSSATSGGLSSPTWHMEGEKQEMGSRGDGENRAFCFYH